MWYVNNPYTSARHHIDRVLRTSERPSEPDIASIYHRIRKKSLENLPKLLRLDIRPLARPHAWTRFHSYRATILQKTLCR